MVLGECELTLTGIDAEVELIALLRAQLNTYSGVAAEARNRVSELERSQIKIDDVVRQTAEVVAASHGISTDWRQVTSHAAVLSDNLLIANAQVEQAQEDIKRAEYKAENATEALMSVEDQLVGAKAQVAAEVETRIKLNTKLNETDCRLNEVTAERNSLDTKWDWLFGS